MEKTVHRAEDRRVKRTKKAMRDCLFRLLEEKSAGEITVKELTEAADVNRSTFYFYYRDINDMIIQIQNEIYAVFERDVISPEACFDTEEDFVRYLTRFLLFCKDHEKICQFVVGNDPGNNLADRIRAALSDHVPDSSKTYALNDPRRYLTGFAVAGCWRTILNWMDDGMQVPPAEMARFMTSVYFFGGRTVLLDSRTEESS